MYGDALKRTIARMAGFGPECVVTGNGSDDILDCVIRAFASPGDTVAHPDPTFVMLPVFSRINGITPVGVPLTADFSMDADALLATNARIIYLCSPNNPTATPTSVETLRRIIAGARGLVLLDEAYAEFTGLPGLLAEAPATRTRRGVPDALQGVRARGTARRLCRGLAEDRRDHRKIARTVQAQHDG